MKRRALPWIAGACAAIVYLLTRTRDVGGDDTVFAQAVERFLRDRTLELEFFQPHHLIYDPIVAIVVFCGRSMGLGFPVLDYGAAVSALAGGFAVFLFARTGLSLGARTGIVASGAAMLGACGGLWAYSTRMEVYALAAAAVALWYALASSERPRALGTGLALAFAILSHAVLGLLAVPTIWRFRSRLRDVARALAAGIGIPAVATLAMMLTVRGARSPSAWLSVLLPRESRGFVSASGSGSPLDALRQLGLWGWYRVVPILEPGAARFFDVAGAAALVGVVALVVLGVVRAFEKSSEGARLAAIALAAFVPLWCVWDVGNVEHAVAVAPLFAAIAILGAGKLRPGIATTALTLIVAGFAAANGLASAVPQSRPENGRVWVTASFVAEHVPPEALILSAGTDARLRLGLGYLSGRHVADLTLAVRAASLRGGKPSDGLGAWIDRANGASQLWALDDVLAPESQSWVSGLGIDAPAWASTRSALASIETAELPADGAVIVAPFRIHRLR